MSYDDFCECPTAPAEIQPFCLPVRQCPVSGGLGVNELNSYLYTQSIYHLIMGDILLFPNLQTCIHKKRLILIYYRTYSLTIYATIKDPSNIIVKLELWASFGFIGFFMYAIIVYMIVSKFHRRTCYFKFSVISSYWFI